MMLPTLPNDARDGETPHWTASMPRAMDRNQASESFNQEMSVQAVTHSQGRIVGLFAKVGDEVKKGQTLFTIDGPDLLQAELSMIAAAGVLEFTTRNLARLKQLYTTRAVSARLSFEADH